MDKLIYQPKNSLIRQSYKARERAEPLNGDGFGIGWYTPEIEPKPGVFVSVQPAWNCRNLSYLAPKIRSNCIFAHVRAATRGAISEANCHPFHYRNFLFMHNGNIRSFRVIKRALRRKLSDTMYDWVKGETDSEHFFALVMDKLLIRGNDYSVEDIEDSIQEAIIEIYDLLDIHGMETPFYLNSAITDGNVIVATRFVSDSKLRPHTLYYSEGSKFECIDGVCRMVQSNLNGNAVLIVSEKLTDVRDDWHPVKKNHMVTINKDLSVSLKRIVA